MTTTEPPRRPEVSEGMAAARARGVHVGRPRPPLPASALRADELRGQGFSLAKIATALTAENVPTVSGQEVWTKRSVQYLLIRLDADRAAAAGPG
jgi:hypothetical protein